MKFEFKPEDIKYIKLYYQNLEDKNCSVRAAVRNFSGNEMMACTKVENGLYIKTPQEISLSIVCAEGIYKAKTTLKNVINDSPYTFFFLLIPQDVDFQQNREYFRVEIALDCIYSYEMDDKFINLNTKTIDISASGITVLVPSLDAVSKEAYLNISAAGKKIKTKVKYIRSEKMEGGYKVSFRYKDISEHDRDYISQICIQKQLADKRKLLD